MIQLGGNEFIHIDFDLFDEKSERLYYSITHCNADWTPSDLNETEYIEGMNDREVEQCEGSFNTYANYFHYRLTLPNARTAFTLSGNYVVKFYSPSNPDEVFLIACFYVYENSVSVSAAVSGNTDISFNQGEQQVSLSISHPDLEIANPEEDLKIYVIQNHRPEQRRYVQNPMIISPTLLSYTHNPHLIFEGGNEFRRFEVLSYSQAGLNVDYIGYDAPYYSASLMPSESRLGKPYIYDKDQNGKFLVLCSNSSNPDTEADYLKVRFFYPTDLPFLNGKLYVYGELTGYKILPQYEMCYDVQAKSYVGELFLKQGAYNYIYVVVPQNEPNRFSSVMEGNHWETENEYLTIVYYHPIGEKYDRIIGVNVVHTQ